MKSGSFPPFFFVGRVRDRDNRNEIGDDFSFFLSFCRAGAGRNEIGMTLIPVVINKILISFSDTIGGVSFFLSLAIFHH